MSDAFQQIEVGPFAGKLRGDVSTDGLNELIARWQEKPEEVIAKGRHRVVRDSLGELPVAVKIFGRQSKLKDRADASRGSKASRSFEAAKFLHQGGVHTPEPIGYLDHWDGQRLQRSLFITRYLPGLVSFRDHLNLILARGNDIHDVMTLLHHVAPAIRKMHDAGFLHRDLGNQNIEFSGDETKLGPVNFLDLNRGRRKPSLTPTHRAKDLARLTLPAALLSAFATLYWETSPPPGFLKTWSKYRRRFALWRASHRYRHPFRNHEEHDPASPHLTENLWLWDHKTAQAAILHDRRQRRTLRSSRDAFSIGLGTVAAAPRVWRHYRDLLAGAFQKPVNMANRIGMSIEAVDLPLQPQLDLLAELPVRLPILIRYAHHQGPAGWARSTTAFKALKEAGHQVKVAILQDRRAVHDSASWRQLLELVFRETHNQVESIEVTHAVNRTKWGIQALTEFQSLLAPLVPLREAYPSTKVTGPACIDFEYHRVIGFLGSLPPGLKLDALSHHLYVDRRGAPEARQGSFSLLEKAALLKAIARNSTAIISDQVIVSEVNWPLLNAAEWSPVAATFCPPGQPENRLNVSPEVYANYLERYLLISLCSGLVERVYWWRLVSRGFGLVSEQDQSRRDKNPAFRRLGTLLEKLGRSTFIKRHPLQSPDSFFLEFANQKGSFFVGWNGRGKIVENLPKNLGQHPLIEKPCYFSPP
ncbi:MAG: lipopolysaccharide kinase InaA family protein [Akkermansiaceae bacterium]